jgi:acetyl-CoA carboxylase carboxyltransferase component
LPHDDCNGPPDHHYHGAGYDHRTADDDDTAMRRTVSVNDHRTADDDDTAMRRTVSDNDNDDDATTTDDDTFPNNDRPPGVSR